MDAFGIDRDEVSKSRKEDARSAAVAGGAQGVLGGGALGLLAQRGKASLKNLDKLGVRERESMTRANLGLPQATDAPSKAPKPKGMSFGEARGFFGTRSALKMKALGTKANVARAASHNKYALGGAALGGALLSAGSYSRGMSSNRASVEKAMSDALARGGLYMINRTTQGAAKVGGTASKFGGEFKNRMGAGLKLRAQVTGTPKAITAPQYHLPTDVATTPRPGAVVRNATPGKAVNITTKPVSGTGGTISEANGRRKAVKAAAIGAGITAGVGGVGGTGYALGRRSANKQVHV